MPFVVYELIRKATTALVYYFARRETLGVILTLSLGGTSLWKCSPMYGTFCIMSVRTLGTSLKKKSTKMPATTPNEPAVTPLLSPNTCQLLEFSCVEYSRVWSGWREGWDVQFGSSVETDAVDVETDFVAIYSPLSVPCFVI